MRFVGFREKRKHTRSFIDLPLEFHVVGVPSRHGGIAVDGSEFGLLIQSPQDIPVGARLKVAVLYPNGFELANFEALAEIVRKDYQGGEVSQFKYGVRLVQINRENHLKLKYILSHLFKFVNEHPFIGDLGR